MINKDFVVMKTVLMLHQELSVRVRKSFEGYRRNRDDRFLPSIAGMIGIAEAIRIAGAIETGELRGTTTRAREHRSESIENELIAR